MTRRSDRPNWRFELRCSRPKTMRWSRPSRRTRDRRSRTVFWVPLLLWHPWSYQKLRFVNCSAAIPTIRRRIIMLLRVSLLLVDLLLISFRQMSGHRVYGTFGVWQRTFNAWKIDLWAASTISTANCIIGCGVLDQRGDRDWRNGEHGEI